MALSYMLAMVLFPATQWCPAGMVTTVFAGKTTTEFYVMCSSPMTAGMLELTRPYVTAELDDK